MPAIGRSRRLLIGYALALLVAALPVVVLTVESPPAAAAQRVATAQCRAIDPNLVHGVCLRFRTPSAAGLTWIGSYRAPNGRTFFCIDYLYDSRLPSRARTVPTERLRNQLGDRVGAAEVAALNYVISRWAAHGTTGSDERDAAIALIVREVMSDGVRRGGTVVYPPGLEVGDDVRPPLGGIGGRVLPVASAMWRAASRLRGPYRVHVTRAGQRIVRLGEQRGYRVRVVSGSGHLVRGVPVRVQCSGPVTCPARVRTGRTRSLVHVTPTGLGRFRARFVVRGPSSEGLLWQAHGWRDHGGRTARAAGVQRGWIAQQNRDWTVVSAEARIRKAEPTVETVASDREVTPGSMLHDTITVSGLPPGYTGSATAVLHGPFARQPGVADCAAGNEVGRVVVPVRDDGTFRTPGVRVDAVGYYTWVVRLSGDVDSVPVTSPCGLVPETSRVVPFTPRVRTRVSRQRALVGSTLRDTVRVSGVGPTPVVVRWTLHGPIPPDSSGSCRHLDWSRAPVADRGAFAAAGDGRYRTRPSRVDEPGCQTYSERIAATPVSEAVATEPGLPVETSLVTRPVTPYVPEVPTGPASGLSWSPAPERSTSRFVPTERARPRYLNRFYRGVAGAAAPASRARLVLPRIGVRAPVSTVGLDRGTMAVPGDPGVVGWLRTTAAPVDVIGSSVISGHVSDRHDRPGALWRLRLARIGDVVRWRHEDGEVTRFEVTRIGRHPRSHGVPADLFRTDGRHLLHLITCAGRVVRNGRFHYRDNLVVTAIAAR